MDGEGECRKLFELCGEGKIIQIKALKSIKNLEVICSNLNLFVGTNSSGKSTFLQSILLLAQNSIGKIGLNGKFTSLGEFREVRNYYMSNKSITINVWNNEDTNPIYLEFKEKENKEGYNTTITQEHNTFAKFSKGFYYLSCHRIGSSDIYQKNMLEKDDFGINGEYALAYLLKNKDMLIDEKITKTEEGTTRGLFGQVNYWLDAILQTALLIDDIKNTNYLKVKYSNNPSVVNLEDKFTRPTNIGAGVSYLVSILIMCLAMKENEIIIIENPEIHLHPKAQSKLCDFLYFISTANRQLFVETHSDHIFNALRVGIATKNINQDKIKINFFAQDNFETKCNPIEIKDFGKIVGTNQEMDINDLFDQFEIDLDKMLGV